jgi:serine/threonine protein phosphatase 1
MGKKQRFIIVSDVHGFYNEMMDALNNVNFNPESDFLVSLGDNTDRGPNPQGVIDYLESLPNKKLVMGNHEGLVMSCIETGFPYNHDWHNGTAQTILDLAPNAKNFYEACAVSYDKFKPFVDKMVDYFETKNYIFVHGWIPLICKDNLPSYYTRNRKFEFNPDWRNAHFSEWEQARWLNGMDMARKGFVEPEKTIVCGHWHCSYGHYIDSLKEAIANDTDLMVEEFGDTAIWEPYYGNGIIAIDRCTAHTGEINVLVIEDEFLEA